jgi:hypothetical protein
VPEIAGCTLRGRPPAAARVYDAWQDGKDNLAPDRAAASAVAAVLPSIRDTARENRRFVGRVVRYLAGWQEIGQFIDIGCGLPADPAVHEIAQRRAPAARVLYVDRDAEVIAHARALLTSGAGGTVGYLEADLRDPGRIMAQAARFIDFTRPVAVLLMAVLHFVGDRDDPAGIVSALGSALPAGSYVTLSHAAGDVEPDAARAAAEAYNAQVPESPVTPRSLAQVTQLLGGLRGTLVAPGVVPVATWRRGEHDPPVCRADAYGAVARLGRAPGRR